jgi:hypothetical protein
METDTPLINPRLNPPVRTDPMPKPKQDPKHPPYHKGTLPIKVQINIACDKIAIETTRIALGTISPPIQQTILTPPCEGSHAMLRIGKTWITTHYKKAIYDAHRTPALMAYMINKYLCSMDTIKTVNSGCPSTPFNTTSLIPNECKPVK